LTSNQNPPFPSFLYSLLKFIYRSKNRLGGGFKNLQNFKNQPPPFNRFIIISSINSKFSKSKRFVKSLKFFIPLLF
jgi:hypothetical protein